MTTAYDVPAERLLSRLADHLRSEGKVSPPEWAPFVRTGIHTENAPIQKDWWYLRVASVLRKVYLLAPVGTSRLSAKFGGARDGGSAPYHPRKGSRNIVRTALQQLEEAGYVTIREKRGRVITPAGQKLLDRLAYEVLIDMAKTNPQMMKYARVK
ncbi:MAG: 30S ribosomal protein S19e [Euryarchaeota archaeon RBG_16_68_12]|nr:MAG: 30S ribosomal protein S19e [Euryarchaeota archaeon RBG_16_68_12]